MEQKPSQDTAPSNRRALVKRAAYVIPTVLAVVKATERPAYAGTTGSPVAPPVAPPIPC